MQTHIFARTDTENGLVKKMKKMQYTVPTASAWKTVGSDWPDEQQHVFISLPD